MTKYHGGKQRIGKKISECINSFIIKNKLQDDIKGYCEPFCGMLGVYKHILLDSLNQETLPLIDPFSRHHFNYLGGDINESVIKMWQSVLKGWNPPTKKLTRNKYNTLKEDGVASAEKGFYGHAHTYRGEFLDSYFPHTSKTIKSNANHIEEIGDLLKQFKVKFNTGSYTQFSNLKGFVIYCDPPYRDTVCRYSQGKNREILDFDHDAFWEWCHKMAMHNLVFVSSYKGPHLEREPGASKKALNKKIRVKNILKNGNVKLTGTKDLTRVEKLFWVLSPKPPHKNIARSLF